MHRVFTNQLLTTFLPTIILWFFGYATLFIDLDNPSDRFMGSGTALLVIATLISMITGGLPKTSYLKLIDIWLIWHFIYVFIMIGSNIFVDRVRIRRAPSKKKEEKRRSRIVALPIISGYTPSMVNQEKRPSQTTVLPFNSNEKVTSNGQLDELEAPAQIEDDLSDGISITSYRTKNVKKDYIKPSYGKNAKRINSSLIFAYPMINILFYVCYFYLTMTYDTNDDTGNLLQSE